ncbi:hypothetical protein [Pseudomonas sp. MWU12-3103b]|uniref:hypothetical protein n=1 Tax=Pseudomonas sp. MWU12-3103b TaxID=2928857 RepID=UPI0020005A3E|nr:hypothetical protein [Pseudomonas sp. MWU12-3103b]
MRPQIEFRHVLGELSVNRNDPCEVLRELISNSYDAQAKNILYIPVKDRSGLVFFDDGSGLDIENKVHGITPWEAFFSIGKSTKKQGDAIGYKCQGSKLCFASSRILVASTSDWKKGVWHYKVVENPRSNLDTSFDISPEKSNDIVSVLSGFFSAASADTASSVEYLKSRLFKPTSSSATLIMIDGLETEGYNKYFSVGDDPALSYVTNYIRYYTKHGDARYITDKQGFTASQRTQVSAGLKPAELIIYSAGVEFEVPFGYPYLERGNPDLNLKSPAQIARLRDGRFYSRAAKKFSVGSNKFSIILAIDGNRRAHDEYTTLARKGRTNSGIKLSDQRGLFVSVKGIKICKYPELLSLIDEYKVLSEGDSASHYTIIVDGDFDLVTNRNSLSKKAYDTLNDSDFLQEIRKFLDAQKSSDKTFSELLNRLRRESSEILLNEQIEYLENAKEEIKTRERFRLTDSNGKEHLFLSPRPGEEYLVGVLYSQLSSFLPKKDGMEKFWRRVLTFSTQGIDSLGMRTEDTSAPLSEKNVCSIEYKYEFNNSGPFNHALAVVDFIVAWDIDVKDGEKVSDSFTCFGTINKVVGNNFEWEISGIENLDGGTYSQTIVVINLKRLISETFNTKFTTP